jgi:hypothetical protein
MAATEQELLDQIRKLDQEQQKRVLDFVHKLTAPQGEPVKDFLERTRTISVPKEDLAEMARFIEEEFERIDWNDWNNPPSFSA